VRGGGAVSRGFGFPPEIPGKREAAKEDGRSSVLTALLTYNLLVTIYLISLGIGGELVGILLWPAIALHALLTGLLGYGFKQG
jgi:hypothetical protein